MDTWVRAVTKARQAFHITLVLQRIERSRQDKHPLFIRKTRLDCMERIQIVVMCPRYMRNERDCVIARIKNMANQRGKRIERRVFVLRAVQHKGADIQPDRLSFPPALRERQLFQAHRERRITPAHDVQPCPAHGVLRDGFPCNDEVIPLQIAQAAALQPLWINRTAPKHNRSPRIRKPVVDDGHMLLRCVTIGVPADRQAHIAGFARRG